MADTQITLRVLDGNSPPQPQNILAIGDGAGNTAYQMALRVAGAIVSGVNALPTADAAADTALGTPADAPWPGSGNGSVIAILKAILGALGGTSIGSGLVATTGGQSGAYTMTAKISIFSVVPVGGAAKLTAITGQSQQVFNRCGTGQSLEVYPSSGMAIENQLVNAYVTVADGGEATFTNDGTVFVVS